jgi:hypothetical protein
MNATHDCIANQTAIVTVRNAEPLHPTPAGAPALSILSPHSPEQQEKEALKQSFLDSLKNIKSRAEALRQSVTALLDLGVTPQQLVAWAKDAGRPDRYSQKLLSQIFLDLGIRRREPGAGPKPSREAILIERYVRGLHGEDAHRFLRASCHVAKARDEGELPVLENETTEPLNPYPDQG